MADRELRRMNRAQLIEIIYALQQEEQQLRQENEMLKQQLADRTVRLEKVGSIAEASLAITEIFNEAQKAADIYINSIRVVHGEGEPDNEKKSCSDNSEYSGS